MIINDRKDGDEPIDLFSSLPDANHIAEDLEGNELGTETLML